jgi:translation initiation factor IF-2
MNKVRINDLARELEVKSKSILDALTAVGVAEKKTHSSSIDEDEAVKVREYIKGGSRNYASKQAAADTKPKFDLSKVSKPGDALKAILERKQAEAAIKSAPPPQQAPVVAAPRPGGAPVVATPARPATAMPTQPVAAQGPRRIVPQPRQQANIIVAAPPAAPAIASRPPAGPVIVRPAAAVVPPPAATTAPMAAAPIATAPIVKAPVAEAPVVAAPVATPEPAAPVVSEPVAGAAGTPPAAPRV